MISKSKAAAKSPSAKAETAQAGKATPEKAKPKRPNAFPSPNPATNLLIADIVVRGASRLFRKDIQKRIAKADPSSAEKDPKALNGHGVIRTLGLYGASKLATRSPAGLGLVAGGLVLKTLYDRGKARQQRKRRSRKTRG